MVSSVAAAMAKRKARGDGASPPEASSRGPPRLWPLGLPPDVANDILTRVLDDRYSRYRQSCALRRLCKGTRDALDARAEALRVVPHKVRRCTH